MSGSYRRVGGLLDRLLRSCYVSAADAFAMRSPVNARQHGRNWSRRTAIRWRLYALDEWSRSARYNRPEPDFSTVSTWDIAEGASAPNNWRPKNSATLNRLPPVSFSSRKRRAERRTLIRSLSRFAIL